MSQPSVAASGNSEILLRGLPRLPGRTHLQPPRPNPERQTAQQPPPAAPEIPAQPVPVLHLHPHHLLHPGLRDPPPHFTKDPDNRVSRPRGTSPIRGGTRSCRVAFGVMAMISYALLSGIISIHRASGGGALEPAIAMEDNEEEED
ncbi:unnamed protein product [Staurois parvus]|uniref:Uncharacterized protein n=1 Tax=Staurois parvus TaxID=386267 RepID=A0ABN9DWZ5_9NEOB|nr:unnamed protein product [Staurois parvus]